MIVPCWPNGTATREGDCDETIPNSDHATMKKYGWGFTEAIDAGSPSGLGMFLACPHHRDYCTPGQRAVAVARNQKAKA